MNWPGPSWKAPKKEPVDGDTSAIFTFWGIVCPPSCDAKIHSSSVIGTAKVQFGSSAPNLRAASYTVPSAATSGIAPMYWWNEQSGGLLGSKENSTALSAWAIDQLPLPSVECATGRPLYTVKTPVFESKVVVKSSQVSYKLPAPAATMASLSALYPSSLPGGGGIGFAWLQVLPPSVDFATPTSSEKELKSRTRFE